MSQLEGHSFYVFLKVMPLVCLRKLGRFCQVTRRPIPEESLGFVSRLRMYKKLKTIAFVTVKKYVTAVLLLKIHFLQNSSLVQVHTSAIDRKVVGNIPESHFVKAFSAPSSHS
jgi:hypothetical protein